MNTPSTSRGISSGAGKRGIAGWRKTGTNTAHGVVTVGGFYLTGSWVNGSGFIFSGYGASVGDGILEGGGGASNCAWSNLSYTGTATPTAGAKGVAMSIYAPFCANWTIDKFDMTNTPGICVSLVGSGHVLKNSTIANDNCYDLINFFGSNIRIQNNHLTCTNSNGYENHADFFQTFNGVPDLETTDVMIEGNICIGAGTDDVQWGNIEDSDEDGNVHNITWRNNLCINVSRTLNLSAPDCRFFNNTFFRCATQSGMVITCYSNFHGHANNTTFQNNLFFECGTATNPILGFYDIAEVTGTIKSHNLVVGIGAGATKSTFSETGGINGQDPLFADAEGGDYRLQNGSPAIAAGVNLHSEFSGYRDGNLRLDAAFTLGSEPGVVGGGSVALPRLARRAAALLCAGGGI